MVCVSGVDRQHPTPLCVGRVWLCLAVSVLVVKARGVLLACWHLVGEEAGVGSSGCEGTAHRSAL